MYMNEHQPPHFHVRYDGDEAMIDINDGRITGSLPRRAVKMVYEWLDLHQEELTENWKRVEKQEALLKIEPLK